MHIPLRQSVHSLAARGLGKRNPNQKQLAGIRLHTTPADCSSLSLTCCMSVRLSVCTALSTQRIKHVTFAHRSALSKQQRHFQSFRGVSCILLANGVWSAGLFFIITPEIREKQNKFVTPSNKKHVSLLQFFCKYYPACSHLWFAHRLLRLLFLRLLFNIYLLHNISANLLQNVYTEIFITQFENTL